MRSENLAHDYTSFALRVQKDGKLYCIDSSGLPSTLSLQQDWQINPEYKNHHADTYRAGEFTITLDDGENGKTYRGCDAKGKCINLKDGTSWRDNGYRGITWENRNYTYSVSWREDSNEGMYLNIYNKGKRILRRKLVAITENAVPVVPR